MKVSLDSNYNAKPVFTSKYQGNLFRKQYDEVNITQKSAEKPKKESVFKRFKTAFVAMLSSLVTAGAVFAAFYNQNNKLKKSNEELKLKLDNIVFSEDMQGQVENKVNELQGRELAYSPMEPPRTSGQSRRNSTEDISYNFVLPSKYEKTSLRSDAKKLKYPVFKNNMPYEFEFPYSPEIKVTHEQYDVQPIAKTLTTVSESYADSLSWDNDKIARDLLQNFYDGHGQTLDGVKFSVDPKPNGKYTVRIEGKSTYSPHKAILLGESSKKADEKAAGNYGEGLKMVVLKLLKEKGSDKVNIASGNWNVCWELANSNLGKKLLAYTLDEQTPIDGNYIEFDTDNVDFIKSIINSFDRFYHYNNPGFKCPDFENDKLGIKLLDDEEAGRFYIAGQAFEINGKYEGLKGMNIYIKNKPPVKGRLGNIFDPSRDRVSLTRDNLEALGSWIVSDENMSKEDVVKLVHSLEKYWDAGRLEAAFKYRTQGIPFICGIYKGIADRKDVRELRIQFPSNCVGDSILVSSDLQEGFKQAGYRICNSYLPIIGMKSIKTLVDDVRKHKPLEPTEAEKNKILILQDALKLMTPILRKDDFFSEDELQPKIFIYNKNSEEEDASYKNVEGEAIVDSKKTQGFWLDRDYMQKTDFSSVVGTVLHELTHKFGGDESAIFSYKLTEVLQKVFSAISEDPNLAIKMKVLEKAWNAQNNGN